MPATFTIPSVFTAVDKFTGPINRMMNKVAQFQRTINAPITALNSIGIYVGLYSLVRAVRGAIEIIADFEQANVNLASVMEKDDIPLLKDLGYQARLMAINYGVAATSVSNLQYELTKMGFRGKEVLNMSEAIVTGATAMRAEPQRMAELMGSQFKAFHVDLTTNAGAEVAKKMIAQLALAANETAADFESYATQLPILGNVSHLAGVDYPKILAMLGVLRDLQVHTATGATGLKNMFLDDLFKLKMPVEKAIEKMNSFVSTNAKLGYIFDKHGKKTLLAAAGISEMKDQYAALLVKLGEVSADYPKLLAELQLGSTWGSLKILKSSYQEFILAIDNGNGPVAGAIQKYAKIASVMLLMGAGSDVAKAALLGVDDATKAQARTMGMVIKLGIGMVAVLVGLNVILAVTRIALAAVAVAQFLWNVAMGIAVVLGWRSVFAIRGNVVAMGVLRIATWLSTAATWAWNTALLTGLGTLLAYIGVIGAVAVAIGAISYYWDDWGAAITLTMGPLGMQIAYLVSIYKHWGMIKKAFSEDGMLAGIKAIGLALWDALLYPLQQALSIMANIFSGTAFGGKMGALSKWLELYRGSLGLANEKDESKTGLTGPLSVEQERQKFFSEIVNTNNKNVKVEVLGNAKVSGDVEEVDYRPRIGSTQGWQRGYQATW